MTHTVYTPTYIEDEAHQGHLIHFQLCPRTIARGSDTQNALTIVYILQLFSSAKILNLHLLYVCKYINDTFPRHSQDTLKGVDSCQCVLHLAYAGTYVCVCVLHEGVLC